MCSSLCRIPGKDHLFEVVTPSRTFFVQVDSDNDMQDWVAAFNTLLKTIRHPPEVCYQWIHQNCVYFVVQVAMAVRVIIMRYKRHSPEGISLRAREFVNR